MGSRCGVLCRSLRVPTREARGETRRAIEVVTAIACVVTLEIGCPRTTSRACTARTARCSSTAVSDGMVARGVLRRATQAKTYYYDEVVVGIPRRRRGRWSETSTTTDTKDRSLARVARHGWRDAPLPMNKARRVSGSTRPARGWSRDLVARERSPRLKNQPRPAPTSSDRPGSSGMRPALYRRVCWSC